MLQTITCENLQDKLKQQETVQLIDVCEVHEFQTKHIAQAHNLPLSTLAITVKTLDKQMPYYVICQSGVRSEKAVCF